MPTVSQATPRTGLWKAPPPGVKVIKNTTGEGNWVEKWWSEKGQKWVHNYTVEFRAAQEAEKFRENLTFARALPKIRGAYTEALKGDDRKSTIALIVALIDQAFFRIGTRDTDQDNIYGVTTLRKRHLTFQGNEAHFDYRGKHDQEQHKMIVDPKLLSMLKALHKACRNQHDRLFRHQGRPISAAEVNAFLADFGVTAKMFRTYHATRLAREKLLLQKGSEIKERKKIVTEVVCEVADAVGHTPAVCRGSYIDPRVIDAFMEGKLR